MELWILLALLAALLVVGAVARLRKSPRSREERDKKNIYPLW